MNASIFYKQKTKHDLKDNCGVRLTGKELFDLMEEYAAQKMPSEEKLRETAKRFEENVYEDMMSPKSIWFIGAIWVKNYINNK